MLTEHEKNLVSLGKLDVNKIDEFRKIHPVRVIDHNAVDDIKNQIRDTNVLYRESIDKNKELYDELVKNRKEKEVLRDKIAELRIKKKELLGLE